MNYNNIYIKIVSSNLTASGVFSDTLDHIRRSWKLYAAIGAGLLAVSFFWTHEVTTTAFISWLERLGGEDVGAGLTDWLLLLLLILGGLLFSILVSIWVINAAYTDAARLGPSTMWTLVRQNFGGTLKTQLLCGLYYVKYYVIPIVIILMLSFIAMGLGDQFASSDAISRWVTTITTITLLSIGFFISLRLFLAVPIAAVTGITGNSAIGFSRDFYNENTRPMRVYGLVFAVLFVLLGNNLFFALPSLGSIFGNPESIRFPENSVVRFVLNALSTGLAFFLLVVSGRILRSFNLQEDLQPEEQGHIETDI